MGCLLVLAAALALAVPASVAAKSLVGAFVVLALLALITVAVTLRPVRQAPGIAEPPLPTRTAAPERRRRRLVTIGVATSVYAVAIVLIHLATRR